MPMKRNFVTYSAALMAMATIMLPIIIVDVYAPTVDKLTPAKGKVGQEVTVHGDGFIQCTNNPTVYYGSTPSDGFRVASDKVIKTTVPTIPPSPDPYDVKLLCNEGEELIPVGLFTVTD